MIPFGSQRASGQELATHLLNAQDNEQIEIAELRGARPDDLHGAFAQWRKQARERTRCRKYLYSLSINPDPAQGPLTRAQYADYIARVEARLGLSGQPRAVVFHVKHGREHCHVVWSRIDAAAGRAVQISFDRTKLMAVTRAFARDHGLRLPEGYYRAPGEPPANAQVSLYEKVQEDRTGLTKDQRIAEVTGAWQRSDCPKAFVAALEERGYILARGKRPYVLIDIYGEMNALPKLIANDSAGRRVRTKDIRAFLENAFPPEALPTVEQARAQAAQRRQARKDAGPSQDRPEDLSAETARAESDSAHDHTKDDETIRLQALQAQRQETHAKAAAALATHHAVEFMQLAIRHHEELRAAESAFKAAMGRLKRARKANAPTGLAAFLGRITGMNFLRAALRAQNDARRYRQHQQTIAALKAQHAANINTLQARHARERREMDRRRRALARLARTEWRTLAITRLRERRTATRRRAARYAPWKINRARMPAGSLREEWWRVAGNTPPSLAVPFSRKAAAEDDEDGEDGAAGRFKARIDPWTAPAGGSPAADEHDRWELDLMDEHSEADYDDIDRYLLSFGLHQAFDHATEDTDFDEDNDDEIVFADDEPDDTADEDDTPEWLRALLGDDLPYDYGDDQANAILKWLLRPLADEFNVVAGTARTGSGGGGGGRSPDPDADHDQQWGVDDPEPPPPKPDNPKPHGPGRR